MVYARAHRDAADRLEYVRHLTCPDANCYRHLQIQTSTIHVRLYFVSLLRKVEVGFCRNKERRYVIEAVLLLSRLRQNSPAVPYTRKDVLANC